METLFYLHIGLAYVSLMLLLLRGVLSARKVEWRQYKLLKIAPHIVDTFLFATGIGIFVWFGLELQAWMFAKLFFLVMYILFAAKAFKKNQPFSLKHFILAVVSFMMIMLVATVK
ncbi:invasion protein expression up-regulator SirB [Muribacter muris]|uniref:Invasion protein expression up-regulator SirB n=1 Tax=Muribacter muris TaxID=67855 RepID=A0A4Y9K2Z3_9PAST|nr:SirB2 family protein [Muribacter muris]MBF0784340.1 SirB2 family protein [Muribacter muris]MBF0827886.1 SirB2 family protein [Muribacter muris]TFV12118.1 invasion protein expression up-regulator SirB [Muribacter muris]